MFSKVLRTVGCNHHFISNGFDIEGFLSLEIYFMQNGRDRKNEIFFFLIDMAGKESFSYSNGKISWGEKNNGSCWDSEWKPQSD